jgi:hypothetical protein
MMSQDTDEDYGAPNDGLPIGGRGCDFDAHKAMSMMTGYSVSQTERMLRGIFTSYDSGGYSAHFRIVRSHKWHVLMVFNILEPLLDLKVSRREIIHHDDSKFSPQEVQGYVDRWVWGVATEEWERALKHHYTSNDHHPQYWENVNEMSPAAVEHAVIDRCAVGWERNFESKDVSFRKLVENARRFPLTKDGPSVAYFDELLETIANLDARARVIPSSCICLQYRADLCLLHG